MNNEICPICGSGSVEGAEVTIYPGKAEQECYCLKCEATWTDIYKLDRQVITDE